MKNKEMVVVDTSIWIEYFTKPKSERGERLKRLLEEDRVVVTGVIMAELLQGARTEEELEILKESFITLPFIKEDIFLWEKVSKLSFKMRKNGFVVPLTDCLIAVLAIEQNYPIFTIDSHFQKIPQVRLYKG
jgi:hypothetical protein